MKGSTLIALALLVVIGISALVASVFLKQKITFLPRAQQSTAWSWDDAVNQCPDKGSGLAPCICNQLQSEGICAPVGSINKNRLVCIANKWDTTWGCWGSPDQANVPGTSDSTATAGDTCGTIKSQYGTCPDWATENSCHQRLDPPGDPDFGKWFKCVNRWWNGPCESKEACDGTAAPPTDASSTTVDNSSSNTTTYSSGECIRMSSATNCSNVCKKGRPGTNPDQEWFCSADGINPTPGQYCCPINIKLTPTPDVGQLGGACLSTYPYCYDNSFICNKNNICEVTILPTIISSITCSPSTVTCDDASIINFYTGTKNRKLIGFYGNKKACTNELTPDTTNASAIKNTLCSATGTVTLISSLTGPVTPTTQVKGDTISIMNGKPNPINEVKVNYTILKPSLKLETIGTGEVKGFEYNCGLFSNKFFATISYQYDSTQYSLEFKGDCDYNHIITIN